MSTFQMRDLVTKTSFMIRKKFDGLLHWLFPTRWVPLYTSVTFSRMRYHHCVLNKKWQDQVRQGNLYEGVGDGTTKDVTESWGCKSRTLSVPVSALRFFLLDKCFLLLNGDYATGKYLFKTNLLAYSK